MSQKIKEELIFEQLITDNQIFYHLEIEKSTAKIPRANVMPYNVRIQVSQSTQF